MPWPKRFRKLALGFLGFFLTHALLRIPCYLVYVSWYQQSFESLPVGPSRTLIAFAAGCFAIAVLLILPNVVAIRCYRETA